MSSGNPEKDVLCEELGIVEINFVSGSEKFRPAQYHTFEVGQISVRVKPPSGIGLTEVCKRIEELLEKETNAVFERKLSNYTDRIRRCVAQKVR